MIWTCIYLLKKQIKNRKEQRTEREIPVVELIRICETRQPSHQPKTNSRLFGWHLRVCNLWILNMSRDELNPGCFILMISPPQNVLWGETSCVNIHAFIIPYRGGTSGSLIQPEILQLWSLRVSQLVQLRCSNFFFSLLKSGKINPFNISLGLVGNLDRDGIVTIWKGQWENPPA